MRSAYIGKIQLSDVDLSYLHEAQKISDITVFMEVTPRFTKGPAFNIKQVYPHSGIFKAAHIYPELSKFDGFLDLDKFYIVNTSGKLWLIKSLWTNILLLISLIKGHFDYVHLTWPPSLYEIPIYFIKRKLILTVHDPFPHSGLNTLIVRLRRGIAFRLIPKFILLNHTQLESFEQYYNISSKRILDSRLSIYNYLRTVKASTNLRPNSQYILFFGKISRYKGIDILFQAMKRVNKECPECKLIVAGSGIFPFNIDEYRKLHYIEIRNRFIPEEELVELIKNAAFVVCPYTDATQSGVIMSAFAFNIPVIATNVGALPEMVIQDKTGYIVKPKDPTSLSEAIINLWKNSGLRNTFSKNIELSYREGDHSWKQIAEDVISFAKNKK